MKKTIVALSVVMLTAPAWAGVAITVTDLGDGKAGIDYSGTELARAFALDITVDAGTIDAISDFAVGDERGECVHKFGLGGDRVGRAHVGPRLAQRVGRGIIPSK